MMQAGDYRYFMDLSFDGTAYNGWQIQSNAPSVQETVETALSTLLRKTTNIVGAGRTDTGVHALNYTAHFDATNYLDTAESWQLVYKLNRILPRDIAIHNIRKVKMDAHARFSALSRSYEYHISYRKNPFLNNRAWQMERKLDLDIMQTAASLLMEYEDFQSFSKANTQVANYRCRIIEAGWRVENETVIFHIRADRFLRNMVRAIVGTIVDCGLGKLSLKEFRKVIESKNRSNAGYSVPGCGLFFVKAEYDKCLFEYKKE